jgi:methyl-accepting chemotaxis protein
MMTSSNQEAGRVDINGRVAFIGLDEGDRQALRATREIIREELPGALDTFYAHITEHPQTKHFFPNGTKVQGAKSRQLSHWETIAEANFTSDYADKAVRVGSIHARIGLEPRWYIGGYVIVLDRLLRAIVAKNGPKGLFARRDDKRLGDMLCAVMKAVMLDVDLAISTYIDASEAARRRAEEESRQVAAAALKQAQDDMVALFSRATAGLADGDLTARVDDSVPEAFVTLKDDFNAALDVLAGSFRSVRETCRNTANAAVEIRAGADDLARRTEQQAASLEETAATTEQLAASVRATAQSARAACEAAEDASRVAQEGGEIAANAVVAMRDIEEVTGKISAINEMIEEIAFQTNLLALNAAVEAARAGEAGKGFAVVAAEVRSLAQRSSAAVKDIGALIGASTAKVENGVRLVEQAGDTLGRIVASSRRVGGVVNEISTATQEQASGIEEMSQAIAHMDEMTQQNAALSEESSACAGALDGHMNRLLEMMDHYKTGEAAEPMAVSRALARRAA